MKKGWIALGVIVVVLVLLGGSMIGMWNNLVGMDNQVQGAWGQVENQLQRRADLIPNLVESAKGLATQERGIIQDIANARARIQSAGGNP
jgi:LemA protein